MVKEERDMTAPHEDQGPVAYLTGDYPKVSHTFIQREVQSVRAAGVKVITCSIRKPAEADFKGQEG